MFIQGPSVELIMLVDDLLRHPYLQNYRRTLQMKTVSDYVKELSILCANSAAAILAISRILLQAKIELSKVDFEQFLSETKYDENSSALRKRLVIADADVRLMPIAHLLPSNWTTIYRIAALQPSDLDRLCKKNILHPEVTAREIGAALTSVRVPTPLSITVQFSSPVDDASLRDVHDSLVRILPAGVATLKMSNDVKAIVATVPNVLLSVAA